MKVAEIRKVLFIGAGWMGSFNAMLSALAGYDTVIYDISQKNLDCVADLMATWTTELVKRGRCTAEQATTAIKKIACTTDAKKAAERADFVSESVFELLKLKQEVLADFEQLLHEDAIITTNTSTLSIEAVGSRLERGGRFAAAHFHLISRLVDVVPGKDTSPETMETVKRFVESIGQVPVLMHKEKPGYLHNTVFNALLAAGLNLHSRGIDFRKIDRVWMLQYNDRRGPFGWMDGVGLPLVLTIGDSKAEAENNHDLEQIIKMALSAVRERVQNGELGEMAGQGFYSYPNPEFSRPEFLEGQRIDPSVARMLLAPMLLEAVALVSEGYASFEDVDRSWMLVRENLGPFAKMDQLGLENARHYITIMEKFRRMRGIPPDPRVDGVVALFDHMISKGQTGSDAGCGFYKYPNPFYESPDFLSNN